MDTARHTGLIPLGEAAPDFTATTNDGTTVQLAAHRGKARVVLVFYPGDDTPVCTAQLCGMRDNWTQFQAEETVVYGVNPAGVEKHTRFVAKYAFPFPLIADAGSRIAALYGCRALFGLVRRTVYLIDK